jgi:pyrophosphate--fructose-6-phosphate 1-phosphotransferase
MRPALSPLERARIAYAPRVPDVLRCELGEVELAEGEALGAAGAPEIRDRFPRSCGRPLLRLVRGRGEAWVGPLRCGVVLSGGQAPGGHNVITGLFDGLRAIHPGAVLHGFLGGPGGVVAGRARELTAAELQGYRNSGGFDLIGAGRDKIETARQLSQSLEHCARLGLDGLVVVGGDDSNTNAAVLAEHFLERGVGPAVVGVPKTIDGDLKGEHVEISFGFDTATRVYAELIGNVCRDARSAGKYWHFVKLMGRSASHVTLECALQTHANVVLIGEEIREKGSTLAEIADEVAEVVRRRAASGRSYGVCLVPEGLVEFIPEVGVLIGELDALLAGKAREIDALPAAGDKLAAVCRELSAPARCTFAGLPVPIQEQLLLDRDAHGNVQVSKIETEQLLIALVAERVRTLQARGEFPGRFQAQGHFLGYEGRCAAPSNFDADYTYALGRLAAVLVARRRTGYLCAVGNLVDAPERWEALGVPLTSLMRLESRKGRCVPVVAKALVRTDGRPFQAFAARRERWQVEDDYRYPGALQYFGPAAVCRAPSRTLLLERTGAEEPPAWLGED